MAPAARTPTAAQAGRAALDELGAARREFLALSLVPVDRTDQAAWAAAQERYGKAAAGVEAALRVSVAEAEQAARTAAAA